MRKNIKWDNIPNCTCMFCYAKKAIYWITWAEKASPINESPYNQSPNATESTSSLRSPQGLQKQSRIGKSTSVSSFTDSGLGVSRRFVLSSTAYT